MRPRPAAELIGRPLWGKKETVNCGAGKKDAATVDKADKVKGCEKVERAKK